ncbi:MAG TPA: hypothetical protein VMM56_00970 [Planctomycetaceae bacterium]|nr:hypothetical protein [Planctomycetaceae bacterium]
MSGPIVRTGTTPKFWANYDNIFGDKKKSDEKQPAAKKTKKKSASKTKKK